MFEDLIYLYNGIPLALRNHKTIETSDSGVDIGHGNETLLPSTAKISTIWTAMKKKRKYKIHK